MLYLVLVIVGFMAMGFVDYAIENFKHTEDYEQSMDNYYQDVRRLQKI